MDKLVDLRNLINNCDFALQEKFLERMDVSKDIALCKMSLHKMVLDKSREQAVFLRNEERLSNKVLKSYYHQFLENVMHLSKSYQSDVILDAKNINHISISHNDYSSYQVIFKNNGLDSLNEIFSISGKGLIVTDSGVPSIYIDRIQNNKDVLVIENGEQNKSIDSLQKIESYLLENHFTKDDYIIALGGGMILDLVGFAAAVYKRGIKCYYIPSTLLAMVDATIGGKCAINYQGYKNMLGVFSDPYGVLIDVSLLNTLDNRLLMEGMSEVIKMASCFDEELFSFLESVKLNELPNYFEMIVKRCLDIKKMVIEQDYHDEGLRKVLNFGHTIGHAIEVNSTFFHGECVAIGMLYSSKGLAKERLMNVLKKFNLLFDYDIDKNIANIMNAIINDKKTSTNGISFITLHDISNYSIDILNFNDIKYLLKGNDYE